MTVSVTYMWKIGMFHSDRDESWDTESDARRAARIFANRYNLPVAMIKIYKTTVEEF